MTVVFEARAASKRFGARRVLNRLDVAVPEGSVTVLLGRNGAGKTTLLRAAMGMIPLDAGSIWVAGLDATESPVEAREQVGFVPDHADAYPWMTAAALFRFLRPMYRSWNQAEAERLAAAFEVPIDVPFEAMSRGQGIKTIIAAALAPAGDRKRAFHLLSARARRRAAARNCGGACDRRAPQAGSEAAGADRGGSAHGGGVAAGDRESLDAESL